MKKNRTVIMLALYLLGLFMGALDTGIVSPARGVIGEQLHVTETVGIWMITIFTLSYAAAIPISGKLADRLGRRTMYIVSIALFGIGSLICSLSSQFGSFPLLLGGRVIQALGGGGIMPIVTAEIGTTFPAEKRGLALGLVGGVYGIANILGSSAGSAILSITGNEGWHWLFLINVPISIAIVAGSLIFLENHRSDEVKRMDLKGTVVLTAMIVSLLYGLTNIEFSDFMKTFTSIAVYPYLLLFAALMPLFIAIEKRAEDPVINLKYFRNRDMVITFVASIIVGVSLMGMVFIPQFAENALRLRTGSGGYFVTALGLFSGIGAPLSGKLIDRHGAKVILTGGFMLTLLGGLFLSLVATVYLSLWSVLVGLFLMGLGMGFTMGTPLNYMILSLVPKGESNSALSTLSLIRSVGTVLSPAIMIGFLATAGVQLQSDLTVMIPEPPSALQIRQVDELKPIVEKMKNDPVISERMDLEKLDIDSLSQGSGKSFKVSTADSSLPEDVVRSLQTADATNITERIVAMAEYMFSRNVTPEVVKEAQSGVQEGIDGLDQGLSELDKAREGLASKRADIVLKLASMRKKLDGLENAQSGMESALSGVSDAISGIGAGIEKQQKALHGLEMALSMSGDSDKSGATIPPGSNTYGNQAESVENPAFEPNGAAQHTGQPFQAPDIRSLQRSISSLKSSIAALTKKSDGLTAQKTRLEGQLEGLRKARSGILKGIDGLRMAKTGIESGIDEIDKSSSLIKDARDKMVEIRDAIPHAFESSKTSYLEKLRGMDSQFSSLLQATLNKGFRNMYILVSAISACGIAVLSFYGRRRAEV